jgi:hypothetical protein
MPFMNSLQLTRSSWAPIQYWWVCCTRLRPDLGNSCTAAQLQPCAVAELLVHSLSSVQEVLTMVTEWLQQQQQQQQQLELIFLLQLVNLVMTLVLAALLLLLFAPRPIAQSPIGVCE